MRELNARNILFLKLLPRFGLAEAAKRASYTKRHGYRILDDPKAIDYLLGIVTGEIERLNLVDSVDSKMIELTLKYAYDPTESLYMRKWGLILTIEYLLREHSQEMTQ